VEFEANFDTDVKSELVSKGYKNYDFIPDLDDRTWDDIVQILSKPHLAYITKKVNARKAKGIFRV